MQTTEPEPPPDLAMPGDNDKWSRERRSFHQMLPDLLRTHPGQFVAIHEGRLVGSGEDKLAVARGAYERFGYVPIFVSRVTAQPAAPARIPSPRLAAGGASR